MEMRVAFLSLLIAVMAAPASAQTAVEVTGGMAGFVDDAVIGHGVIGVGTRTYVTPRLSIGPELVYMRGPGHGRELFVTANITYEFRQPNTRGRVVPFVVAGGGFMRHSNRFGPIAGDWRLGWELHSRFAGLVAYSFGGK
jgi:hypothetical protein